MKLKISTTSKVFDKICLKSIRNTFFQHAVCNQGGDGVRHEGEGKDSIFRLWVTSNGRVRFKILGMSVTLSWSHIKNISRRVLGLNTVMILKRLGKSRFSSKATNLQHVRLEMKKGWQNLSWCSIYVRLSIHLKIRSN